MADASTSGGFGAIGVAAVATLAGPMLGPIMLVVVLGAVGSFIAAAEGNTRSVFDVLVYVLRGAMFAFALAFLASDWIELHAGLGGHSALAAVAALIGYRAHQARDLAAIARLVGRLRGGGQP